MRWNLMVCMALLCTPFLQAAKGGTRVEVKLDQKAQTIHSFGASDCWRTQYIGLWADEKREAIADLLFSDELDKDGSPKGIALSMWRFNIGSGSHDSHDGAGVASDWRRTECFLDSAGGWDWSKQAGQRWMLEAARERGVKYSLGFSISAPYFMSKNGLARASDKSRNANLKEDCYDDYAQFMAEVCNKLKLDYLSPINEPQWEWVGSNQEGMQATNEECSRIIRELDGKLESCKVVFGEAGDIRYLYRGKTDKPQRDNQIAEMFRKDGRHSIANLSCVAPIISGHSYWSTYPIDTMIATRDELRRSIPEGYEYWQTEYCPMESNRENPGGGGRDMGMNTALYIARVIHHDLTVANATSWQSWTAFSEANYKDGLIFIDSNSSDGDRKHRSEALKSDGKFSAAKTLWSLGNYSRFVRPGMVRVEASVDGQTANEQAQGLMVSSYIGAGKEVVLVLTNYSNKDMAVELSFNDNRKRHFKKYVTSEEYDLEYRGTVSKSVNIPARSIVTLTNK